MNVSEIFVGDTLQFETRVPAYPATEGYTLRYRFAPLGGGTAFTVTATASADAYAVNVPAATTAGWSAGEYSWTAWVESGSARYTVGQGSVTLRPNPASATQGVDARSVARKMLSALDAAMLQYAQTGTLAASYQINGRSMTFRSAKELRDERDYWAAQVAGEDAVSGIAEGRRPFGNKLVVRLG